jgi:Uncharacterized protein conserved in bacteria
MSAPATLTPYLVTRGAEAAARFYCDAFGAEEVFRLTDPGSGKVGHAELRIGASLFMLADEYPGFGALAPDTIGGTAVTLHLSCADVDATAERAVALGAMLLRGPTDQSFGERVALILDPFGHRWMLATRIEDVPPDEMQRRWNEETGA